MPLFGFDFQELPLPPDSQTVASAIRPYVETCIDAFGATRCMFESNFPVDKGCFSYSILWNAYKRITEGVPDAERAALFRTSLTKGILRATCIPGPEAEDRLDDLGEDLRR